jgi:DNA-binding transcriptional regulator YdaS (Cro superfamily)
LRPMHIRGYLKKHRMSQAAFAELLEVSQGLVWQWLEGQTKITADRAKQIELKTNGEITRSELRPDLWERAA